MRVVLVLIASLIAYCAQAQNTGANSPYTGEDNRKIKSLSSEDITQIKQGKGWGLAKMAELNGYPGPAHVLELAHELELSDDQISKIEREFERMQAEAMEKGEAFIKAEETIDQAFETGEISTQLLGQLVMESAERYGELRLVHLEAHLSMMEVLSGAQIQHYNELRGYSASDPCASVPAGHNAEMWKKHNGCDR